MKLKEIYMYLLGAFVVGCAVATIVLLIFFPIPVANHDVIMLAIGGLLSWAGLVVGYFYGSSKGSADKNEIIKASNEKQSE